MQSTSSSMRSNINFVCKNVTLFSLSAVVVMMMAGTFLHKFLYHSPVFIALWAIAAISGLIVLVTGKVQRRIPVFMIHVAFAVILAGAMITHVTGTEGTLHLRLGDAPTDKFEADDGTPLDFPFSLYLKDFEILRYPGTEAPMDYISTLEVDSEEVTISMNRIFRGRGYRLYQHSYDEDGLGSRIAVSHDPWGIAVTYSGYALLLLSLIAFFFERKSGFRAALSRVSGKAALAVMLLVLPSVGLSASARRLSEPVSDEFAEAFGKLYVYYGDRVVPMQTLARDYTMKIGGKAKYQGMSAEQFLLGWMLKFSSWSSSFDMPDSSSEEYNIMLMAASGSLFKAFPYEGKWYSPADELPGDMPSDCWLFIRRVMSLAIEAELTGDTAEAVRVLGKIREYQVKTAGEDGLPSDFRFKAECFYNKVGRPMPLAMGCVTVGLLLFIISCLGVRSGWMTVAAKVLSLAVLLYLSLLLALRWIISGHVPMSNGYETMTLMAWLSSLVICLSGKRFSVFLPQGFLLCGFCLLVAVLGESDPKMTNLAPVLSSPLLSLHVASMMISYTLLGIVMLSGIMGLVAHARKEHEREAGLMDTSLVVLYPAVFCLVIGTFLGAVWANVSWGRYWGWDPKEVWALITMLVYAAALHGGSLKVFRKPHFFHWYCVVAFLCVLVTYFGVNFFLGGLHSYA